jgi:hypothetical protein
VRPLDRRRGRTGRRHGALAKQDRGVEADHEAAVDLEDIESLIDVGVERAYAIGLKTKLRNLALFKKALILV